MTPHEKWLKRRRGLLTASDIPAVLGKDEYKGPLKVWANKVHGIVDEVTMAMEYGSHMEPYIHRWYVKKTGHVLIDPGDYEIAMHPDIPYIGATLDRECRRVLPPAVGPGAMEMKALKSSTCKARDWVVCPPEKHIVQNQVQMACAGMLWGTLVAFINGSDLVWYDHLRNDGYLASIYPHLEEFWWHVQNKIPPPDTSPGINIVAKQTWTDTDGGTVQMEDYATLADMWEYSKEQKLEWTKEESKAQGQLRVQMGNNSFGMLGDGTYLERKQSKDGQIRLRRVRPGG